MKSHQTAMAADVCGRNDEIAVETATQTQTAFDEPRPIRSAPSTARFAPASVALRTHTLILTGQLDRRSALALEAEIERLCQEGVTGITLDLRELSYIDPIGVAVIAFRCGLCQRRGYDFGLIRGSKIVHRAFELAGVVDLLPFREEEVALQHLPARPLPRRRGMVATIDR
jgi:anti-anti-sigma factor